MLLRESTLPVLDKPGRIFKSADKELSPKGRYPMYVNAIGKNGPEISEYIISDARAQWLFGQ